MGFAGGTYFQEPGSSLSCVLTEEAAGTHVRTASKVICTIGPNSNDVDTLCALLDAGMSIARFDFSYGDKAFHQIGLDNLRIAMQKRYKLAAVMMDTVGPEIFVINRPAQALHVEAGSLVKLVCSNSAQSGNGLLAISFSGFEEARVQPGTSIFIGQYLFTGVETTSLYLTVQQVSAKECVCVCNNTATLDGPQLVVHIGNVKNSMPVLSGGDKDVLATWAAPNKIDFLNVSFCRSAQDVQDCRAALKSVGLTSTQVVAKIESREGLVNYKEIVEAADVVVFSRGNLGICLDAEKVFLAQKMLLQACNVAGKPVFVTRVVDSMTEAPRPTRAEATDVANIVLDGADGIQLGAEVFRGKYVVETVKTVMAICRQAEKCFDSHEFYRMVMEHLGGFTLLPNLSKVEVLASTAVRAASKVSAALIVVFTVTGRTARMVAKYRPAQSILTVVVPRLVNDGLRWDCSSDAMVRQSLISRGITPICFDPNVAGSFGNGAILKFALAYALGVGMVKNGDHVVVSQCPRANVSHSWDEAGVVKLMKVDTGRSTLHRFDSREHIDSNLAA